MIRMACFLMVFSLFLVGCAHVNTKTASSEESFAEDAVSSLIQPTDIPDPATFIDVDELPVQLQEGPIEYPEAAKQARKTADVIVQAYVGPDGKVLRVNALKCSRPGMGFEEAAIKAAFKGLWRPAKLNGKPVGVWVAYKVDFVLK